VHPDSRPIVDPIAEEGVRRSVEEALGVEVKSLDPIGAGLGLRSFYRVHTTGVPESLVVRVDAAEDPASRPAGIPPEPALEPLRTFLAEHGVPVPLRFGGDGDTDLLEDLGSCSLQRAAAERPPAERLALYEEACDLVVRIQRAGLDRGSPLPAFERHLDRTLFAYKADLFAEWSLPGALGRAPRASEREVVHEAFEAVAELAEAAPQRLAHRDFQSSNLYLRPERRPGQRLAMIDFQGAFLAPPEYDLVCLLRDSYVELADDEVAALLARVRPRLPDQPEPARFLERFAALTLTRKGKDHARLLSASATRGARTLLTHVPATVRYLKAAASECAPKSERFARFDDLVQRLPEHPEPSCAG
jgi:aminoglycoside/choline kinase family phosphotransferase